MCIAHVGVFLIQSYGGKRKRSYTLGITVWLDSSPK